jgi:hypothetical protein
MPRPPYPRGKSPRYPLDRRFRGPPSRSGRFGGNSWPYRDWNSDHSVVQPVASLSYKSNTKTKTVFHTNTNCEPLHDTIFASAYVIKSPTPHGDRHYYNILPLALRFQNLSRCVLTQSKHESDFISKQHAQFVVTSLNGIITERMWRVSKGGRRDEKGNTFCASS